MPPSRTSDNAQPILRNPLKSGSKGEFQEFYGVRHEGCNEIGEVEINTWELQARHPSLEQNDND